MNRRPRAIIVDAPWGAVDHPSIHIGLLKRCLEQKGLACDAAYANLWLLDHLSREEYLEICEEYSFVGEWLFTRALFGEEADAAAAGFWPEFIRRYPDAVKRFGENAGPRLERLRREVVPRYVDDCLSRLDWGRYAVVGFTCTFDQIVASLALARHIKRRHPQTTIVFGGSQMDDPMGPAFQRAFPWIDYLVLGEGEESFPELVSRVYNGGDAAGIPGVAAAGRVSAPPRPVKDLDRFPIPDYSDYFRELDHLCARGRVFPRPTLLLETSKGCWWGEKSHCVFCSLNDDAIAYRSKSPQRVLAEIREQSARHESLGFRAVDSIFNPRFFDELLPRLRALDLDFYFEAKGNLDRPQLAAMAAAGVTEFLIGIDSLSTPVLKLMRKGGTLLRNVQVLKWARYYGISTEWTILYRCPGETAAMYADMIALMPKLRHLEPPRSLWRLKLLRFSPFYDHPEEFGIREIEPLSLYRHIFPPGTVDLDRAAFIFDAKWQADAAVADYLPALRRAYDDWRAAAGTRAFLEYRRGADFIEICDARAGNGRRDMIVLEGWEADVYEFCGDKIRTRSEIERFCAKKGKVLDALLTRLESSGLLLREGASVLSLALPARKPVAATETPARKPGEVLR